MPTSHSPMAEASRLKTGDVPSRGCFGSSDFDEHASEYNSLYWTTISLLAAVAGICLFMLLS